MANAKITVIKLKKKLVDAENTLDSMAESYSLSDYPSNVRLKNSNL
jgi:hypothetical protein